MAYRFTNTEKWQDSWFSDLSQIEMLLFIYLCDSCDIAGFIEINYKRWASDLNSSKDTIEGACKGLARGLIYSKTNDCIFIKNFLKHQKNLPLNEKNQAHKGIIKRFELYSEKFDIKDINDFIEGACKGLLSPYGNGIGNGIGNGKEFEEGKGETLKTWKTDFETYKSDLRKAWIEILTKEYIEEREKYHPNLDIEKTIEKACKDYWITETGWKKKKASRISEIDWKATFNNALSLKSNQVYNTSNNGQQSNTSSEAINRAANRQYAI